MQPIAKSDALGDRNIVPSNPKCLTITSTATIDIAVVTMTGWVESRSSLPPKEINGLFRSLIMPSLAAILD